LRRTVRESKITSSARQQCGVTGEQLWLKINEPTEKDKGKYTMDIFDGKDGVKRVFDLSGQGEWDPGHFSFEMPFRIVIYDFFLFFAR